MAGDVLVLFDDAMIEHDPGPGHPERPDRLRAIRQKLHNSPIPGLHWSSPQPAGREAVERIHCPDYVDRIDSLRGRSASLDPDTVVSPPSVAAAYLAAGAAADAARAVVTGAARRAFALGRPPGHHAEADRAMGFCLFNNIAIAAAGARAGLGCRRILIVDWDVHHGNGTQHAFFDRSDILFFSTHRFPFYPGTGDAHEVGTDEGIGFTVNVPLPEGFGDDEYLAVFRALLVPIADSFEPDLILVSAGFDAHRDDPLGGMSVTRDGFAGLCGIICDLAQRHAAGRLALILEGGYDLGALSGSVHACLGVLASTSPPPPPPQPQGRTAGHVIKRVREIQKRYWPL